MSRALEAQALLRKLLRGPAPPRPAPATAEEPPLPSTVVQPPTGGGAAVVWEVQHELGKGHFAAAFQFRDARTGTVCAAKVIAKAALKQHPPRKARLQAEIDVHRRLSNGEATHPNVLRMLSQFEDSQRIYMMLELCPHQVRNQR